MKILVTGSSGFIGYHLCHSLLEDEIDVFGIDNLNDYYDPNLKFKRLNKLTHYNNFKFKKIDISDKDSLFQVFRYYKPNIVVNLAAQAGVRYSIENPQAYITSNLDGFFNVIDLSNQFKVDGLIYASSSSVYGSNKKVPFSIEDKIDKPMSLYAATKASNELIARTYSHLFGLNTTGLRYFTVYGPWGRPDMAMFKFTKNIIDNVPITVYNNGKMKRDFTYIDDIIKGTKSAINRNLQCEIFNLGNNKSEELLDMIRIIENEIGRKAIIDFQPIPPGDVKETFADIDRTKELLEYFPSINIDVGIKKFINWYFEEYKI